MTAPTAAKPDGRVARRQGTRELIMDAATRLFAARGVTSTSIDDIAASAGIAKGSIYYNFESKAGLVEAIMARSGEILAGALATATTGRSGVALRAEVVRALLWLVREHTFEARVMVTELFRTERSWRESIEAWRAIALAPLVADLEASGVEAGQARVRAASIVGATLMAGLEWLVFHPEYSHEEVAAAVLDTLGSR
ncbi:MAG: TetR family transcriptional regulator [Propionicimonas sp.]